MNIEERLLSINPYSRSGEKQNNIQYIVVHYVGNAGSSAIANRNYFESLKNQNPNAIKLYFATILFEVSNIPIIESNDSIAVFTILSKLSSNGIDIALI